MTNMAMIPHTASRSLPTAEEVMLARESSRTLSAYIQTQAETQ